MGYGLALGFLLLGMGIGWRDYRLGMYFVLLSAMMRQVGRPASERDWWWQGSPWSRLGWLAAGMVATGLVVAGFWWLMPMVVESLGGGFDGDPKTGWSAAGWLPGAVIFWGVSGLLLAGLGWSFHRERRGAKA